MPLSLFKAMGISEIRKRSNQFVANLNIFIAQSIESNDDDIVQLNRDQMLAGKYKTGKKIKPKYSSRYAQRKGFSTPNLKLKGDFQRDMFLTVDENNDSIIITSDDEKTPHLVNRYTTDVFGIPKNKYKQAQGWTFAALAKLWNKYVLGA